MKISFDKENVAETIRAKRIIADMLQRGYCLLIEVERDGKKAYERVKHFDEEKGEYLIADFDSLEAAKTDASAQIPDAVVEELSQPDALPRLAGASKENKLCECGKPLHHRGRCLGKAQTRRVPMEQTRAVGIPRSAGG